MGKTSDELIAFILNLTPTEKRRIRQYASLQGGQKDYEELFNYLLEKGEINTSSIKDDFKGKKFLGNISKALGYLFDSILDALATFYFEADSDIEKIYRKVKIAFGKRSYHTALRLIRNGKVLAQEREDFFLFRKFLLMERRIVFLSSQHPGKDAKRLIAIIRNDISNAISKETEIEGITSTLENLLFEIRADYRESAKINLTQIESIKKNPFFILNEEDFGTKTGKLLWNIVRSSISALEGNYEIGIKFSEKAISILNEQVFLMERFQIEYFRELHQAALFSYLIGDFSTGLKYIHELSSTQELPSDLKSELFFQKNEVKLYYAENPTFSSLGEEAFEDLRRFKNGSEPHNLTEEQKLKLYFLTGNFLLWRREFQKAKEWFSWIVYQGNRNIRKDFGAYARLFLLLIFLELSDWETIEEQKRSFKIYLKETFPNRKSIDLIFKYCTNSSKKMKKLSVQSLQRALAEIIDEPEEKRALLYFNYKKWFE